MSLLAHSGLLLYHHDTTELQNYLFVRAGLCECVFAEKSLSHLCVRLCLYVSVYISLGFSDDP